jgi:hypothetical protein
LLPHALTPSHPPPCHLVRHSLRWLIHGTLSIATIPTRFGGPLTLRLRPSAASTCTYPATVFAAPLPELQALCYSITTRLRSLAAPLDTGGLLTVWRASSTSPRRHRDTPHGRSGIVSCTRRPATDAPEQLPRRRSIVGLCSPSGQHCAYAQNYSPLMSSRHMPPSRVRTSTTAATDHAA